MALIEHNTLGRDQKTCAHSWGIQRILRHIALWYRRRHCPHIRTLSARQARDAGIGDADIAIHHHRLPSQTTHHPRL